MSMRRVSSRPRLVSDADRASQISSLDMEEHYYSSSDINDGHQQHPDVNTKTGYSYFLFGHDADHNNIGDVNNGGREVSGDEDVKSSAVLIASDEEREGNTLAANNKMSLSISDDTLSDYASCCLYYEDDTTDNATNSLRRDTNPSLTNLEMSFKKTSISSNEDEGGMEAESAAYMDRQLMATTTTTTSSVKRKRHSQQHYLTPNSSYAELQQNMWYPPSSPLRASYNNGVVGQTVSRKQPYHCFTNNHHHLSTTATSTLTTTTQAPLLILPEETLVLICTHLTHNDIRSFGSTCQSIRMVVMSSACAIETLWMERLRCRFPVVFCNDRGDVSSDGGESGRRNMMHSSNVNFVDDFMLPMAATGGLTGVDNISNDNRNMVNLPLLTGLLAPRYPQAIVLQASLFRAFDMSVTRATAAVASPMIKHEVDDLSVIQFTGRVGTGDRSIRSDRPFPPNCRAIGSSSSSSHGGASLKSLSTWMKNHTPLRSRGNKRKNGRAPAHSMVRDLSPPPTPTRLYNRNRQFLTLSNSPLHARRSLHLPLTIPSPSRRSPLFRFLSSLSHHCDYVSSSNDSSFVDIDNEAADVDDIGSTISLDQNLSDVDDDDQIGVNDYGMTMIRHNGNGLLEQCKQKFGYNKSIKDNLRPFVIPTVVSVEGEVVSVDVTPRLVAYFEVTIVDQRDETSRSNATQHVPQQPQHHAGLHHNDNGIRHHRGHLPRPRRRNAPLGGHRALFAPLHAQDRVEGQAAVAPNNFGQQPPRLFHHDHDANIVRPRQQRHDCVAIGLSTLSFNPQSRMPGWDEHSFGYHGDDGGIFHGHGDMLRRYGPSFGPGDTIGCGLEYSTRKIFFVKNGEFLGFAFEKIDKEMVERGLYPTVGVDTECPIHVNFGQMPFKFDWKGFGREKLYL